MNSCVEARFPTANNDNIGIGMHQMIPPAFSSAVPKFIRSPGKTKVFVALLVVICGVMIYWPAHDILLLPQGDIGRDLYTFQSTARGAVPYRDYYYTYGPLMPYYYAFFYRCFSENIPSIILARIVLNLASGLVIYTCLSSLTGPAWAVVAAIWFWTMNPDFFHTFNHTGGVVVILLVLSWLLRYVKEPNDKWLWLMAAGNGALLLIKVNMGLAVLAVAMVLILSLDFLSARSLSLRRALRVSLIFLPAILVAVAAYVVLLFGLPSYYLKQCLPVGHGYDQFTGEYPLGSFLAMFWGEIVSNLKGPTFAWSAGSTFPTRWPLLVLLSLIAFVIGHSLYYWIKKGSGNVWGARGVRIIGVMLAFLAVVSHEYIWSVNSYQLFWPAPVLILVVFFMAGRTLPPRSLSRKIWMIILVAAVLLEIHGKYDFRRQLTRDRSHFLEQDNAGVYVRNSPEWVTAVTATAAYLHRNLGPGDTFLAVPYSPVYYYLTQRPAPVRELVFFDFMFIPTEQEERIIRDLERERVNFIVLSNRMKSSEPGLGVFGESNCPRLFAYIRREFEPVRSFGDWGENPGFLSEATVVCRRVQKKGARAAP